MHDDAKRVAFYLVLALATTLAVLLRSSAFAPDHLWLDDQWVAVLVRDASLADLFRLAPPVPLGFVLLLKAFAVFWNASPGVLQLLPLTAGILLVPTTGVLALRITDNPIVALLSALLVAVDPLLAEYSARVKPFAIDALATALIALAFVETVQRPSPRALAVLAATAALSILVSFAALISGAVFVHLGALVAAASAVRGNSTERARLLRAALASCAAFDAFALLLFGAILRAHGDAAVFAYWEKFYLPLNDREALRRFLVTRAAAVADGILPSISARLTAMVAAAGALVLIVRRETRVPALALAVVFIALFAASALHRYPAGAGRTDLFTHPLGAVFVAAAIDALASARRASLPWVRPAVVVAAGIALVAASERARYPASGDRDVIEHAVTTVAADDTIVIYPWSSWAVALYGGWPVHLRPEPSSTNGFYAVPDRPNTLLLGETVEGESFLSSPNVAPAEVEQLLAGSTPSRIHLIATQTREPALGYIRDAFQARGYVIASTYSRERASQDVFEQPPTRELTLVEVH